MGSFNVNAAFVSHGRFIAKQRLRVNGAGAQRVVLFETTGAFSPQEHRGHRGPHRGILDIASLDSILKKLCAFLCALCVLCGKKLRAV
jgi:hypothetical protein